MNESDKLPNGTRLALPAGFYVPASVDSHRKHQRVYKREEFIMVSKAGLQGKHPADPKGRFAIKAKNIGYSFRNT